MRNHWRKRDSGVHALSDIVSDVVAWVAVLLGAQSRQGRDLRFHYGRRRIETLLSLAAAFLIAYVSVELVMDAMGYHRADSVGSLAVLVSLLISSFFPALELVDQITTVIIASLILHGAWEVGSNAVKELIDFAPSWSRCPT